MSKEKIKAAIIGPGNIGTDLLIKAKRSDLIDPVWMVGVLPDSPGLARAAELGLKTTADGVVGMVESIKSDGVQICFDATSAYAHEENSRLVNQQGAVMIDLTPAAIGPFCVPPVNLASSVSEKAMNVNLVSCGGQATIPIVAAVSRVQSVEYAEIVATVASKSIGPGTRQNIDEFTRTTASGVEKIGGAKKGSHLVELPLGPVGEGMVMALGATHIGTEKDRQGVRQAVQGHARIAKQVAGRSIGSRAAIGREHTANRLVPGTVFADTIFQPTLVETVLRALDGRFDAKHVGIPIELVGHVALAHEQVIDESCAFVRVGILRETPDLLGSRDAPHHIEVDPAHEDFITGRRVEFLALGRKLGGNSLVDGSRTLLHLLPAQGQFTADRHRRWILHPGKRPQLQRLNNRLLTGLRNRPALLLSLGQSLGLPDLFLRKRLLSKQLRHGQPEQTSSDQRETDGVFDSHGRNVFGRHSKKGFASPRN